MLFLGIAQIAKSFNFNTRRLSNPYISAHCRNIYICSERLSANTVIHHHDIIRKCLDYAFKMDIIQNNPADKVQRPKKEQFIEELYTTDQLLN